MTKDLTYEAWQRFAGREPVETLEERLEGDLEPVYDACGSYVGVMKWAMRSVAIVGGFLTALLVSQHDAFSWYGSSHGDDPLALIVWILSTYVLVKGANRITS